MATAIILVLFALLLVIGLKKLSGAPEKLSSKKRKILAGLLIIIILLFFIWLMIMVLEVGQHMRNL